MEKNLKTGWFIGIVTAVGVLLATMLFSSLNATSIENPNPGPCKALFNALVNADSPSEAAGVGLEYGITASINVGDGSNPALYCWDTHDDDGGGQVHGLALTDDSGQAWVIVSDNSRQDDAFWADVLSGIDAQDAARTEFGFATSTGGHRDFWSRALAAVDETD